MSDIFGTVQSDHDFFTKIASKIPGFKGYVETKDRRASDKLLREEIARQFSLLEARVSGVQTQAINMGDIEYLDDLESSAIKLRQFADRIRGASYGYSALFAAVKVKKEDLSKLYSYDLTLLNMTEGINSAIDNVEASLGTDGIAAALRHLIRMSQEAVTAYENRHNVILDGGDEVEMPAYNENPAPVSYDEVAPPAYSEDKEEKSGLLDKVKDLFDGDDD
ncbi:MAG: hypothetical protein J7K85_02385 [Anaerolineaceae bacterium]|nr:hypothetical protein [Anaerolineaceae bacterium]